MTMLNHITVQKPLQKVQITGSLARSCLPIECTYFYLEFSVKRAISLWSITLNTPLSNFFETSGLVILLNLKCSALLDF